MCLPGLVFILLDRHPSADPRLRKIANSLYRISLPRTPPLGIAKPKSSTLWIRNRRRLPFPRCPPTSNLSSLPASPSGDYASLSFGVLLHPICCLFQLHRLVTTLPFPSVSSYAQFVVSSSFTLSSGTTEGSYQPSSISDTKQPHNISKSNAFSDQLKKLYCDISHLESRLLADSGEPQDERVVWAAFPSLPFLFTRQSRLPFRPSCRQ